MSFWRNIEKLLSRNDFFSKIEDIGLIGLILEKYSCLPNHITRELDLEESYEKAELQVIKLLKHLLPLKKLASDTNFEDGSGLAKLLEAFSRSMTGS